MRYGLLSTFKYFLKSRHIPNSIFTRQASSGLGYWNNDLTTDRKHEIEKYWRDKIHKIKDNQELLKSKNKFYCLSMFPYPSGSLHMGHVRVYTISDTVARFYRMKGLDVIHPMGWDAFGLPAENAAIERNTDPEAWTNQNIQNMREQLYQLGCSFDAHRELSTCDPNYYKWTQELFLKLFENGLLYQKEAYVNWDPVDKTVLADEQVDENNRSWRSGAIVEKKLLRQWFVKTTLFAESLLEGLNDKMLKEWRDIIKIQQHWIGECTGTNIDFQLISDTPGYPSLLTLWTDKPEFIETAKFLAISKNSVLAKIEKSESSGAVRILKAKVVNPFTNEQLPIFVTDRECLPYPIFRDDYLGIPCSEADIKFCEANDIKYDVPPVYSVQELQEKRQDVLQVARKRKIGGYLVSSKLRDWLISRQRYWGTPIPIIHCENCGSQPVARDQLPVELPKLSRSSASQRLTLKNAEDWVKTLCPKCNGPAQRETDTMDTFFDSSWYFIRYIDPKNQKEMFSKENAYRFLPVDLYIGGKEHAALHLYYARFINHFLHSLRLVPTREPFQQLLVQGMVMGQSYCNSGGKYLRPQEVEYTDYGYIEKETGQPVATAWEKMSKSKYNGVDPSDMFKEYSVDTIRLLMLADVAPVTSRHWSKDTFPGILNWQRRLWEIVSKFVSFRQSLTPADLKTQPDDDQFIQENDKMFDSRNYYLHGATFNILRSQQLNIAISKMLGLTGDIRKASELCIARSREYERVLAVQIIMLAPFAPHFASELWSGFCSAPHRIVNDGDIQWEKDVLEQRWPEVDMEYKLKVRVKFNNKDVMILRLLRRKLDVMTKDDMFRLVMQEPQIQKSMIGRQVTKVIYNSEIGCGANITIVATKIKKQSLTQKEALSVE